MTPSHEADPVAIPSLEKLRSFLRRTRGEEPSNFERFEEKLHEHLRELEQELLAEELARYDVDVQRVEVEGTVYRRSLRCAETYTSAAGPVRVERTLYAPSEGGATQCPLELRAGIIEGRWTPRAAQLVAFTMAHLTANECEKLFRKLGGMTPSHSSLDRLPRKLSERWEENRRAWETGIRMTETIPEQAKAVAVSVDGVMVPMREDPRSLGRAVRDRQGSERAFREAGCATLSLYDGNRERLRTIRLARMPQEHKKDLGEQLKQECRAIENLGLRVARLADGAPDNWRLLHEVSPKGVDILDFWHATEHLASALDALYGEGMTRSRAEWEKWKAILRDEKGGVDEMIRALENRVRRHPRSIRKKVRREIRYFRRNRSRMRYAKFQAMGLPIGTGVVEASCKTLVTARMKRSGMCWRMPGGQAILTLRSLEQSGRWEKAWHFLSSTYCAEVKTVESRFLKLAA